MNLTPEDVKDIVAALDSTNQNELYLQTGEVKLSLRRSSDGTWVESRQVLTEPKVLDTAPTTQAKAIPTASQTDEIEGLTSVRAPLLGTFYRAPKPGAPPFVEVGSRVTPETVVGIIETMKLMNSVYAGVSGEVHEICLEDGEFAEKSSILIRVKPELT